MYKNIEKKIKTVAQVFMWIGIVCSVLSGVMLIVAGNGGQGVLIGLGIIVFGSLLSWIGNMTLYGLGQLIENTKVTNELLAKQSGCKCGEQQNS